MTATSSDLDHIFQALADPSRRAMIARLTAGPASVSELAQPLPMSLAAVAQHVQILEASGLIRTYKTGRVRICQFEPRALRRVDGWIAEQRAEWERRLDQLGVYLTADAPREGRPETTNEPSG